jgi:transcriptional regulator with XRE-family HTH domain
MMTAAQRKKERARGQWIADLGLVLKRTREARGMSTRDLATLANVPQSTVLRYEGGQREPRAYNLIRLAQAMGATDVIFAFLNRPVVRRRALDN